MIFVYYDGDQEVFRTEESHCFHILRPIPGKPVILDGKTRIVARTLISADMVEGWLEPEEAT